MIDPSDRPTFLLGLNHIDPSPLEHLAGGRHWQQRYGGDIDRWLQESVAANLRSWGFNALGMTAELVQVTDGQRRYSGGLNLEQTRSLQMPFAWQIPWDQPQPDRGERPPSDYRSDGFSRWCDEVARTHCRPLANDRNLIGYWYRDRPPWTVSPSNNDAHTIEQTIAFYQTTRAAVRRYDPEHLILGDVLPAEVELPPAIAKAAEQEIDVLSVASNASDTELARQLSRIGKQTTQPMLVADHAIDREPNDGHWPPTKDRYLAPGGYASTLHALTENPQVIGYFLCGSYLRSPVNRRGLLDENERPDALAIDRIERTNATVTQWVRSLF